MARGADFSSNPTITFNNLSSSQVWPAAPNSLLAYFNPRLSNGANFYSTGGTVTMGSDPGCSHLAVRWDDQAAVVGARLLNLARLITCHFTASHPGSAPVTALLRVSSAGREAMTGLDAPVYEFPTTAPAGYVLGWPGIGIANQGGAASFTAGGGTMALGTGRNCADFSLVLGVLSLAVSGSAIGAGTFTCSIVATDAQAANSPQTYSFSITGYTPGITFFTAGDCDPHITISNGGLTLGVTSSSTFGGYNCRANTPKYSGLWYFEATPRGTLGSDQSIGLVNNGNGRQILGGYDLFVNNSSVLGQTANGSAAGVYFSSTGSNFNTNYNPGGFPVSLGDYVSGQTIGIALDLNSDPPQVWVTLDAAGTGGYEGGPIWNGSTSASPLLPGSGVTNVGTTGLGFWLRGYEYSPAAQFRFTGTESITFNFGGSSFVGTVPSGFQPWNAPGGAAPVPGPGSPETINIANAPGWAASTSYAAGDRVVAGPGWTPGSPGSYTWGSALYLWAANATGGPYTSGSTEPVGFASCASPANHGGGFTGTTPPQWTGATTVSDNGIIWTCLSPVDYVTLTGLQLDDAQWVSGAGYLDTAYVTNGGNGYLNTNSGTTTSPYTCSGTTPPTGTGTTFSGTCNWRYQGPITYSSEANRWAHQRQVAGRSNLNNGEYGPNSEVNLVVWYGGLARQLYQNGANGENNPIAFVNHSTHWTDGTNTSCIGSFNLGSWPSCNGTGDPFVETLEPAPGDSFRDNAVPASTPLAINSSLGVTIYSNYSWNSGTSSGGEALVLSDCDMFFTGLQMQSIHGPVMDAYDGPGSNDVDVMSITNSILDAGGGWGAMDFTSSVSIRNSVIIYRGTQPNGYAILTKYPTQISNDTLIGPGVANCSTCIGFIFGDTAIGTWGFGQPEGPPPNNDNVISGFADLAADSTGNRPNTLRYTNSYGDATDVLSTYSGGRTFTTPRGELDITGQVPGIASTCTPPGNTSSCYGLNPSNQFVTVPSPSVLGDLRIKNASADVYGGGFGFTTNTGNWIVNPVPGQMAGVITSVTPDIFGTARPTSGRYDIGAKRFARH